MTPPTGLRKLAYERVPCGSGALRDQAKSLAKQQRANWEGDYTDGLVAVDAGRYLSREGMQRPLARQARQAAGFLPPCRGGKRFTNPGASPLQDGPRRSALHLQDTRHLLVG